MAKWHEEGRLWEADHGLMDEEQIARCARADEGDPFPSPVPTRMVSNGEYMPVPQTEKQKRVEARIQELSEHASRKLGVDRRRFLKSTGGMAAAFLAMNEVFGRFFDVDPIEMFEAEAYAQTGAPRDIFVFDDQLHFVRGTRGAVGMGLRSLSQGPSSGAPRNPNNPKNLPDEHGDVWGAVSGGCVEGAVVEAAGEVLAAGEPRLLHFGIADSDAWDVGLPCGGEIDVFVEEYRP